MFKMKLRIWLLAFIIGFMKLKASVGYANMNYIQPSGLIFYWDYNSTTITGELHATNATWLVFGIQSLNATSSGTTDWIVAWLNKATGIGHFSDRYSLKTNSMLLQRDATTDWIPLDVYYSGNDLVVKFTRPIVRCDSTGQDIDIEIGLMTAMYAYGPDYTVLGMNGNANISLNGIGNISLTIIPQGASVNLACPTPIVTPPFNSQPTATYTNYAELMPSVYRFYWNFTTTSITGEIHVKTTGWVGFGLSPNGGMHDSDVIVGWITNDGKVNFTDRHIDSTGAVLIDSKQDWQLLYSRELNGYTVFKFTRLIQTCDSQDRDIEIGSPHVIFSFGTSDPASGSDITYHGVSNRGTQEIVFISSSVNDEQIIPANAQKIQFSFSGVIIPRAETYYYNEILKIPDLPSKMHILKYEISLPSINIGNMHHLLYYECVNYNGTPAIPPGDSTTSTIFDQTCTAPSAAWAVGGVLYGTLPNNTGISIGNGTDYTYLRVELHYNNPNRDFAFIDRLTLTLYATSQLRQYDVGMIAFGTAVDPLSITIPPGETAYNLTYYCYNQCLSKKLNGTSINIIRALPHTHLMGTRVSTRLIRNGTDIGVVYDNPYYDFNFQQTYALYPPVVITPDDALVTQCTYNTMSKTNFTYGGFGTKQEMCLQYLTYYPRIPNFVTCLSLPSVTQVYDLLISMNKSGLANLKPLTNVAQIRSYVNNGLLSIDQTSPLSRQAIEQFNLNHSSLGVCGTSSDGVARGPITAMSTLTPSNACSQRTTTRASTVTSTTARTSSTTPSVINSVINIIINAFSNWWSNLFH